MKRHVKNIIAGLFAALLIGLGFSFYSYAAGGIVENANIKLFVGGQQVNFTSTLITVNGQILLNSEELLIKLGVPYDNKHIQMNKNKKILMFSNGKKQIKMTVNSTKAAVGKSSSVLNAAPVLYKNKYYIPAKSTAQLLDMKYAWDEVEKSVYIQKLNEYNKVKAVLDKAVAVSRAADKYMVEYSVESTADYTENPVTSKASTLSKVDKKKMIMNIKSNDGAKEYYLSNNYLYSKYSFRDLWEKEFISEQEYKEWMLSYDISKFKINDILYCGLTIQENKKENTILLKGNVFLHVNKAVIDFEPVATYLVIIINKSNYLINSITHTYNQYQYSDYFGRYLYSSSDTYRYLAYNGEFVVETPDESKMDIEGGDSLQKEVSPITVSKSEVNKISGLSTRVKKVPVDDTFTGLSEDARYMPA